MSLTTSKTISYETCTCQGHIKCCQRELTTEHYSAGEVWVSLTTSKTIFCTASILRDIPRAKKQICEENKGAWNPPNKIEFDRCNHWFHFKPVSKIALFIMIIVVCFHCFVLLKFVKV